MLFRSRFDWIFLARSGVNLALVGALVFALQPLVKLSLAGLLAGNVVVIGVFLALARLNRVFTAEEADYINKFLPVKAFIF